MTDSSKAWRRPGKGRPRNEDRAEILVHFAQEREKGLSIGDIARRGMSIYGYGLAPDGRNRTLSVLRSYAGATLERRYREYLQEVNQSVDQCVDANMVLDGIVTGPVRSKRPLSFPHPKEVRRGRPRKNRAV